MKITIIGSGYVGLVTGVCLAELGHDVLCLESDEHKLDMLREGCVPIHEAGLADLMSRNRAAGRLRFASAMREGVAHGELLFIAVGTPPGRDGQARVQPVLDVAHDIGCHLDAFKVIAVKSTVPVGTGERVRAVIQSELQARGCDQHFAVVSNPEFLKEGSAVEDFMCPDRIVIGCEDDPAASHGADMLASLYAPLLRERERLLRMPLRAAELTKYAANAMLATRISFINEMACLADALGVDIEDVRHGIGADPRIGSHFLHPGCGYGGSCLPKDVQALLHSARDHACRLHLLEAVERINQNQKQLLVERILHRYGSDLSGRRFALWGLAFKPGTDDMREAPSRVLVRCLVEHGAAVAAYDPAAMQEAQQVLAEDLPASGTRHLSYAALPSEALREADALVIATEWPVFRRPDFAQMKRLLKSPVIFDGRNLYSPSEMASAGFEYYGIGRSAGERAS